MWEEEVGLVSLRWSTLRRRGTVFVWRWRDVMLLTRFRTVILHVPNDYDSTDLIRVSVSQ
jgi:hypothetical protein